MLGRGDLTGPAMAQVFVDALPLIQRVLRRFALPLAASLSSGKSLRVLLAAGEWLKPPKEIK